MKPAKGSNVCFNKKTDNGDTKMKQKRFTCLVKVQERIEAG